MGARSMGEVAHVERAIAREEAGHPPGSPLTIERMAALLIAAVDALADYRVLHPEEAPMETEEDFRARMAAAGAGS